MTQTTQYNFDTSDESAGTCSVPSTFKPVVHVTVGARHPLTKNFIDADQVLTTGGSDLQSCTGADEGQPFQKIHEGQGS